MEIGLGTVQFGLDYGISNSRGRTPFEEVVAILREASHASVTLLDTASAYGISEEVLGRAMPEVGGGFRIVTKTKPLSAAVIAVSDVDEVERAFEKSLRDLRVDCVDGLMVHHAADLLKPGSEVLWDRMRGWRDRGLVRHLGVSVYDPDDTRALASMAPEIIQLPMNFLDQRFLRSGELARLKSAGVEIHVRSLFLQGALLMEPSSLPAHLQPVRGILECARRSIGDLGVGMMQACFGWLERQPEVSAAILGVTTLGEWKELLSAAKDRYGLAAGWTLPSATWACEDQAVINPSCWPRKETTK